MSCYANLYTVNIMRFVLLILGRICHTVVLYCFM